MRNVYEEVDRNKTKSVLVVVFFAVFVIAVTYLLGVTFGYDRYSMVGLALVVSGFTSFFGYWYSDKVILSISGARVADSSEDRLFRSVAENLSIGEGIPVPKLYVIEDSAPNAFATGRDINNAVICVTTGLLEKLDRTELEGVVAHEMSHIKNYDTRLMSVVAVLVGMITLLADWLLRARFRSRSRDEQGGNLGAMLMILGIFLALLSPIIAQLIQLAISRRREFLADAESAKLTRQPSGLIRALKKISQDKEPLEAANKATAHLYIENPFKNKQKDLGSFAKLFNTHPPVEERIKALEEML